MLYAAASILHRPEDAEDAVQAASWKAFERLSSFRGESSFNTWLTSIAVNQARMRRREMRRDALAQADEVSESTNAPLRDTTPNPEEAYARDELVRAVHREIRRLPKQLRRVMLLHIQDLPIAEAAEPLAFRCRLPKRGCFARAFNSAAGCARLRNCGGSRHERAADRGAVERARTCGWRARGERPLGACGARRNPA